MPGWITNSSLVRRTAEVVWTAASRRHLARLDRLAPARCQKRILLGLVHRAQATHFGRDHDFRRIRSIADYRRLVPLYSRAELWREYWQLGHEDKFRAATVRERLSNPSLTVAVRGLSSCHRSALHTALALAAHLRPRTRLLSGALLFLTEEGPSNRTEHALLSERLPALIRPYTVPCTEIEAERFAHLPVTGLIGPAERLLLLLEQIKQVRGKRWVRDVWPQLSVLLYTRRPSDGPASQLRAEAGEDVLSLEMVGRAEGPIAVEDPRHGLFRLLVDHGVYFEFVPPEPPLDPPPFERDLRGGRCPRLGIEEIELGVPYELALTSPAGLWACRLGHVICFERRQPPLVRFVETAICKPTAAESRRPVRAGSVRDGKDIVAYASGSY